MCGMRDYTKLVPLDKYRMAIYNRLVIKCPYSSCSGRFMMKNRQQHYENNCSYFKYFECHANICRIKLNKTCKCEICLHHDCYGLTAQNFESEFEGNSSNAKVSSLSADEQRELMEKRERSRKQTTMAKGEHCKPCPECKDKRCEVKHRCGAAFNAEKCKPGSNVACIHPCGVKHGQEECKGKPCGQLLKCAKKTGITYTSEAEVREHWSKNCEAFFFYCPNCSTQFKNKQHNCVKDLKEEKEDMQEAVRLTAESLKELREDAGGLIKHYNPLEEKFKEECDEFWDQVYKKLTADDRQECLDSITEVIECQGAEDY